MFTGLLAAIWTSAVRAEDVIRIGDINSYKSQPQHLDHYKKGMGLALEEVNAAGGVNGKKVELLMRDDNGNPGDAVRAAEELVTREQVKALSGSMLSNVGLALGDFAKQRKVFFLATMSLSDKIIWQNGSRYTFRLRAGTYTQTAMLVEQAVKLKKKRWAIVYPNYEFGQSAAATFKSMLKAAQPDVEFVAEQASPLGKLEPGSVVQALADANPDAILNVLFGSDLIKFARAGKTRGLFDNRLVVSLNTGEPENLEAVKDDITDGWIVTGYPYRTANTEGHEAFVKAYHAKYGEHPRMSTVVGYAAIKSIAEGLKKAQSEDTEKLVDAFANLQVSTPFGKISYRPIDNQSTFGSFVGKTKVTDGVGTMVDATYLDGANYLPSDEEIKKMRPPR
jgi:branched-chain amino acid transport system substrate-binding protein